ncbi:probable inactive receptor kinase RLK902 [Phoenix dactylifera]|uniref:Probable inactive receptor kinase RLK902 n=1 Tax=Phoenix dactylifera TaxID=42345 RepID=A0A8B8ZQ32_PHODC|nr:probable inactive receptor kinase RLK902 [Phoenix dactylifera]
MVSGHRQMGSPHFLLVFLLLPLFCCFPGGAPDLEADRAALLAFRAAVGREALPWNASASPCTWMGVMCGAGGGRVTELHLPGARLMGQIPAGTLGNLTALQSVSLRFNALSGPLPPDLGGCKELRGVYLHENRFSGGIPAGFFSLGKLAHLNLASNNISGGISSAFNSLTRLRTLYLESNRLSGEIPDLDLSKLVNFNVSFNRALNGSIPARLRRMPRDAFMGTGLCGGPLGACSGEISPASPPPAPASSPSPEPSSGTNAGGGKSSKLSGGAIAGIAIGSAVGLLIVAALLVIFCRRGGGNKTRSVEAAAAAGVGKPPESDMAPRDHKGAVENGTGSRPAAVAAAAAAAAAGANGHAKSLVFFSGGAKVYDLEDLLRASAEVLGKGTTGTTYKAMLEIGMLVAVKRLKDVNLPEKEFRETISAFAAMDHQNLVPLQAFYYSRDEKLLIYDYMPMGSLSSLLHGNRVSGRTPLDWETRYGIALSAARGIEYIHSMGPGVSHGNIKSSNILLSKSFEAHVSEHGLANLVGPSSTPSRAAGYRAPEVTDIRKVSQKGDVYSFGVLLLELLTGKAPAQAFLNEDGIDLPRWVHSVAPEEWTSEVFDLELLRYHNVEEEMVQLLQLAIDCAAQYPEKRPSMADVVVRIEEICRSSRASARRNQQQEHHAINDSDDQSSKHTDSIDESRPSGLHS